MEYKNVLKTSKDRDALEAAWARQITENETLDLVGLYLNEGESEVVFTAKNRGRAWGGDNGRIRLPGENTGCLTLGLVLHEIAHIIAVNDKGANGHGPEFVKVLDGLVWSEREWENDKRG